MASEAERALPPRAAVCYDDLLDVTPAVDPMEGARLAAKKRWVLPLHHRRQRAAQ